jgi:hypothetical protein
MALKQQPLATGGLSVATAWSAHPETVTAIAEVVAAVMAGRSRRPDFVSIHHGASRRSRDLWPLVIEAFDGGAIHGATSCRGVMTDHGIHDADDDAIGIFALWDGEGAYGAAMEPLGTGARAAARNAARTALRRAGRSGEAPDVVWLAVSPGQEEEVIEGIKDAVGSRTLIVGGSAADGAMQGDWSVFSSDGVSGTGVVVSVLFPSTPVASVCSSGYAPTDRAGTVTAAEGRLLREIDGRPAADVYFEWQEDGARRPPRDRRAVLSDSALAPLGRRQSEIDGIEMFLLAHPGFVLPDGSLELFAEIAVGEEVRLMTASRRGLVESPGHIARQSRERLGADVPAGALVVYCGGCMMAIRDRMSDVVAEIRANLGGAPFLGVFTFGEQVEVLDRGTAHTNLMISCTTFAARPAGHAGNW